MFLRIKMEFLHCLSCRGFLWNPVTVSCGHSFCKRCLEKTLPLRCLACGQQLKRMDTKDLQSDVVLVSVLDKCLDNETKLSRPESNQQDRMESKDYEEALETTQMGSEMDAGDTEMETQSNTHHAPALQDLLSVYDFECSLCIRMLYKPVATPCGHTFCKECLERCLDHRPRCPLCKQSLQEFLKVGKYNCTMVLENIMSVIFPSELEDRRQVHETEMAELSNLTTNIPIFVCTMAFPGILCPLHVFEPRYRLMMRRCQETGTKRFGMCIYENSKGFADFGCMLEIQTVAYLADGRSHVETIGRQRFRVLRRGQRDGYHTADIEYLEDKKVEGDELAELHRLHDHTYQQVERWLSEDREDYSSQIFLSCGPLPAKDDDIQASPDGPAWCWWLLSILPLDSAYQMLILSMTSLKDRLIHMKRILDVFLQIHT
uniref:LON peptidase N-terminal domain and RING finger protein 3-like isoform X2 n=1 Tax=Geotrypetes seraphini TaxID=260995 RepID=A0A6P8PH92_GEOSA|nr:LON peptidase N-terminal domain and RING finger protein 3-like isoform X2 [Geotrypetes seraphini]